MYEEIGNKNVKCRKNHSCEWCTEIIPSGEKARYRAYKIDGDFRSVWMHLECYDALIKHENIGEDGFATGEFARGSMSLKYETT